MSLRWAGAILVIVSFSIVTVVLSAAWSPPPKEITLIAELNQNPSAYVNRSVRVNILTVEPLYHVPEERYPFGNLVSDGSGTIGFRWGKGCPLISWLPGVTLVILRLGWVTDMDGRPTRPVFYLEAPCVESPTES